MLGMPGGKKTMRQFGKGKTKKKGKEGPFLAWARAAFSWQVVRGRPATKKREARKILPLGPSR